MSDTQLKLTENRNGVDMAINGLLFNMIKNDTNWKYPVHAIIPADMFKQFDRAYAVHCCGHLIKGKEHPGGMIEVTAPGYYVDCGS